MQRLEIELEKSIVQMSIEKYKIEFEKAIKNKNFSNTKNGNIIIVNYINCLNNAITKYVNDYSKGKAVRSTLAASVFSQFSSFDIPAVICMKTILNTIQDLKNLQSMARIIGDSLEAELRMQEYKNKNIAYYQALKKAYNRRGANAVWTKNAITHLFEKKLNFHLNKLDATSKIQAGLVLIQLFIETTGLVKIDDYYCRGKHIKRIIPTEKLLKHIEDLNSKFEILHPQLLPMVCKPKPWTDIFEGGYITPYMKRNRLIKNDSRSYLSMLHKHKMPLVYNAINHLQNTAWKVNSKVLDVTLQLWTKGNEIAGLPNRENELCPPFPFPELSKDDVLTEEQIKIKKAWKRKSFEIHNRNVQKASQRISIAMILSIAQRFSKYEKIYFPHQMDFRGRLYPIPVLLQPQGNDLAKSLLSFAKGKPIIGDKKAIKWLKIHGANMFGYDKASYDERVKWVEEREQEICSFAENPIENRGWAEADKPFQFLAWCFEYAEFLKNPRTFETHIPIQLDGSCNGLQHFSALLKDEVAGKTVNLVDSSEPSDIYQKVADKLKNSLEKIKSTEIIASKWLELGFDRKLTKRPVMTLPYGVSEYGCRKFISDYLVENYSPEYLWKFFGIGNNPTDCVFKVSLFLSKHLWQAIKSTLKSAIVGMDFLKKVAKIVNTNSDFIEWETPAGLIVRQAYQAQKKKVIRTELYGSIVRTTMNFDNGMIDKRKQLNGIAPNFIHSLDATCLMIYLNKCQTAGINSIMAVHDCYAVHATDTELSAKLLREAFVEIYRQPVLANFLANIKKLLPDGIELPALPEMGKLDIEAVLDSKYFFN